MTALNSFIGASLLLLGAMSTESAVASDRPLFQNPPSLDASQPATSPREAQVIEGFQGRVRGLLLFGINGAEPSLRPATWRVEPGQTLQFSLRNDLPCTGAEPGKAMRPDQTNMHVHGLLVHSNERDMLGRYGDNSMLVVESQNAFNPQTRRYRCGLKRSPAPVRSAHNYAHPHEYGSAQFSVTLPQDHPFGLSWYHPHVHEVTGHQVGGGMSGLIEIGDIWRYAYSKYSDLEAARADELSLPAEERIGLSKSRREEELRLHRDTPQMQFLLKDLQLKRLVKGGDQYRYNPGFVPDLCGRNAKAKGAVCRSKDGQSAWLFTVNGQVLPQLQVNSGERQVWRIANIGATLSYQLQLRVTTPRSLAGRLLPLQVLASDGVAFRLRPAIKLHSRYCLVLAWISPWTQCMFAGC
jgi:L-ascorbate oxidase